jgi:hypothetical protein
MLSSLDLVDKSLEDRQRVTSVAMGYHGMHRYATAKWLGHLEQLSALCQKAGKPPDPQVKSILENLSRRHELLSQAGGIDAQQFAPDPGTIGSMAIFQDIHGLHSIVNGIRKYEQALASPEKPGAACPSLGRYPRAR